jgi:hypothetical protein
LFCGKLIEVIEDETPGAVTRARAKKFCSKSCAATYNNRRKPKRVAQKQGHCERCGKEIQYRQRTDRKGSKQGYIKVRFCLECRPIAIGEGISKRNGKKNGLNYDLLSGMTKGEILELCEGSPYWSRLKIGCHAKTTFKRGKREKICSRCGFPHATVSHKHPVSEFPDTALIKEINDPKNLVSLCPNCHWMWDRGHLTEENFNLSNEEIIRQIKIKKKRQ